jgi:hypothetical protein
MEGTPQGVGEGRPAVSLSLQAGPQQRRGCDQTSKWMGIRNGFNKMAAWWASALHSNSRLWSVRNDTLLTATDAACMTHRQSQVEKWKSSPMQRVNPSQIPDLTTVPFRHAKRQVHPGRSACHRLGAQPAPQASQPTNQPGNCQQQRGIRFVVRAGQ